VAELAGWLGAQDVTASHNAADESVPRRNIVREPGTLERERGFTVMGIAHARRVAIRIVTSHGRARSACTRLASAHDAERKVSCTISSSSVSSPSSD
jgi:hypothetical protein